MEEKLDKLYVKHCYVINILRNTESYLITYRAYNKDHAINYAKSIAKEWAIDGNEIVDLRLYSLSTPTSSVKLQYPIYRTFINQKGESVNKYGQLKKS